MRVVRVGRPLVFRGKEITLLCHFLPVMLTLGWRGSPRNLEKSPQDDPAYLRIIREHISWRLAETVPYDDVFIQFVSVWEGDEFGIGDLESAFGAVLMSILIENARKFQ